MFVFEVAFLFEERLYFDVSCSFLFNHGHKRDFQAALESLLRMTKNMNMKKPWNALKKAKKN